ncbi:hypothetical protein Agub_g5205, partial [Astrephomene gubernaculifera]
EGHLYAVRCSQATALTLCKAFLHTLYRCYSQPSCTSWGPVTAHRAPKSNLYCPILGCPGTQIFWQRLLDSSSGGMSRMPVRGSLPCCLSGGRFLPLPSRRCVRTCQLSRRHPLTTTPFACRRAALCIFASSTRQQHNLKEPSSAPSLPQWCHRVAGAFALAPFLLLSGNRHAHAYQVLTAVLQAPRAAASARPSGTSTPVDRAPSRLYDIGAIRERSSPYQARIAAALATALVGYGLARSAAAVAAARAHKSAIGTTTSGRGGDGGGSSSSSDRASVVASAVAMPEVATAATATAAASTSAANARPRSGSEPGYGSGSGGGLPGGLPATAQARLERLERLYLEVEDLKARNARVWQEAMRLMQADASLTVATAAVKAAQNMDLDNPAGAAATAIAANRRTSERLASPTAAAVAAVQPPAPLEAAALPVRPSGGAARSASNLAAASSTATAAAAAALEGATEAGVPLRPSGGAVRGFTGSSGSIAKVPEPVEPIRPSGGAARGFVGGDEGRSPNAMEPSASERPSGGAVRAVAASSGEGRILQVTEADVPLRPSGGAARGVVDSGGGESVARVAEAVLSVRPSGGAARGSGGGMAAPLMSDTRTPQVPMPPPVRPGGASVRSGPTSPPLPYTSMLPASSSPPPPPPLQMPPDSSRVRVSGIEAAAATATAELAATARQTPATKQEVVRPSFRPTRRGAAAPARAQRTFRTVPSPPPAIVNPSFDVPADAPSPQDYLQPADGRTADGRVNPSFASVTAAASPAAITPATAAAAVPAPVAPVAAALSAAAAPATPEAAVASSPGATSAGPDTTPATAAATQPAWYNPLSWFSTPAPSPAEVQVGGTAASASTSGRRGRRTNPSFDASLAVANDVEVAAAAQAAASGEEVLSEALALEAADKGTAAVADALPDNGDAEAVRSEIAAVEAGVVAASMAAEEVGNVKGTAGKYDPIRNFIASAAAPSASRSQRAKYDMLDELLLPLPPQLSPEPAMHSKYDMVGSLLKDALLAAPTSPPAPSRYDPLSAVLRTQDAADGGDVIGGRGGDVSSPGVGKYDMIGQLLAAAAALPEDLASGKWAAAQPRDPLLSALGDFLAHRESQHQNQLLLPPKSRQPPAKYDMVGQMLQSLQDLPYDLENGSWAASHGRDPLLDAASRAAEGIAEVRKRFVQVRIRSKSRTGGSGGGDDGDAGGGGGPGAVLRGIREGGARALAAVRAATAPLGNVLAKATGRPYEVAPGVVMKVERSHGSWNQGAVAFGGGGGASASLAFAGAGAAAGGGGGGGGFGGGVEELPAVLFQFKDAGAKPTAKSAAARATPPAPPLQRPQQQAATASAVRRLPRAVVPPSRAAAVRPAAPIVPPAPASTTASAEQRPARAVVPPLRNTARPASSLEVPTNVVQPSPPSPPPTPPKASVARATETQSSDSPDTVAATPSADPAAAAVAAVAAAAPSLPSYVDVKALAAAVAAAALEAPQEPAAVLAASPAAPQQGPAPVTAPDSSLVTGSLTPPPPAAPAPPRSVSASPSEVAIELVAILSAVGGRGGEPPSVDDLVARFGEGFADVVQQMRSLRNNAALLSAHPAAAQVMRAASAPAATTTTASAGNGEGMWTQLYGMLGAVRQATDDMQVFMEQCRTMYPDVHALLATGDAEHAVSVLCTLCILIPEDGPTASTPPSAQR